MAWMSPQSELRPLAELKTLIEKYDSDGMKVAAVKLMLDGVMEGGTAVQVDNYIGHDKPGTLFIEPDTLAAAVVALDAQGIQVKMHGYGSLAVREGLNAIESALKANGQRGLRHHIDHLAQVHPDDYSRFGQLEAIAGFTPLWAMPNNYELELAKVLLGDERWAKSYPTASIRKLGGRVISGSDWPVTTMNPFESMGIGTTRVDPVNPDRPALNPSEAASIDEVLASYTIDAAYVMHQEDKTGSIEIGKLADMIVLDRDLFNIPLMEIKETKVLRTIFNGKTVYQLQDQ